MLTINPRSSFKTSRATNLRRLLNHFNLLPHNRASNMMAPFPIIISRVKRQMDTPRNQCNTLNVRHTRRSTMCHPILMSLTFKGKVLVTMLQHQKRKGTIMVRRVALYSISPKRPRISTLRLHHRTPRQITHKNRPRRVNRKNFVPSRRLLTRRVINRNIQDNLTTRFQRLANNLQRPLLLTKGGHIPPRLIRRMTMDVTFIIRSMIPYIKRQVNRRTIRTLRNLMFIMGLHHVNFNLHHNMNFNRLKGHTMVNGVTIRMVRNVRFRPLHFSRHNVINLQGLLPRVKITSRVTRLRQVKGLHHEVFHNEPHQLQHNTIRINRRPLLLSNISAISRTTLNVTSFRCPTFRLRGVLQVLLTNHQILTRLPPNTFRNVSSQVFTRLRLHVLTRGQRVLLITFRPHSTNFS